MPVKLPGDALPHIIEPNLLSLAHSLVLHNPDLNVLRPTDKGHYSPLAELLQTQMQKYEAAGKLLLPDLSVWGNKSVAIFSDYSGEASGKYYTYSFLICAMDALGFFRQEMKQLRQKYSLGEKELAFKDFRMGNLRKALPEYLVLLDKYVPGLLLTVVIDKQLMSVIGGPPTRETQKELAKIVEKEGFGKRKPAEAEKLCRVVTIASFLVGLLARSGQKIFWMTDHDNICANTDLHNQMLAFFQKAIPLYSAGEFPLIGGARPFTERSTDYLDLLSAADLVAGSIEHYLTRRDVMGADKADVREGADKLLYWLGHDGLALKKFNVIMRPGENGVINSGTIEFTPIEYPADASFVPITVTRR